MAEVALLFPHQLFEDSPLPDSVDAVYLIEEHLFFKQFAFHKQKLAFHRASMKAYQARLERRGRDVTYIEANDNHSDIRKLIPHLKEQSIHHLHYIDPTDDWLGQRIQAKLKSHEIKSTVYPNRLFINTPEDLRSFFKPDKKKFFQTKFYIEQREKLNILIDSDGKPEGGKWSFDADNRKKYPKDKTPPTVKHPSANNYWDEAVEYVETHFSNCPGSLSASPLYPIDSKAAGDWLDQFLEQRFAEFGPYEDAIVADHAILHHSVLTPMLNTGLITPKHVVKKALEFSKANDVPINTIEGFVRQVIGWREFIRGIYECKGRQERTTNYWQFTRKIPESFYTGKTGIPPVDSTIQKVLETGYCHHIERLMVLGNFMLLCEFDPDEVYRWFMELFIDAYDWVMVPNVYGMSQFADGGLMSTKPYISGSNYLMKMSDYEKGPWQDVWDGLFWRFMHVHRDFFQKNPRMGMLIGTFDKMDAKKRNSHLDHAEAFLSKL